MTEEIKVPENPIERYAYERAVSRYEKKSERAHAIIKQSDDALGQHIYLFLSKYTLDEDKNEDVFNSLNKSWKQYCAKTNRFQKLVRIGFDVFEKEIERIKGTEEFKNKIKEKLNG